MARNEPACICKQGVPWPVSKPRCANRNFPPFRSDGKTPTMSVGVSRIWREIWCFTKNGHPWRTTEVVIWADQSTNGKGQGFRSDSRRWNDPGVVVSFDLDRRIYTIACDRYSTPAGNLCAIAAYIEGLRAQERHGVASLGEMLAGHAALPGPREWWQVLDVERTASIEEIKAAYRRLAAERHPDKPGGSHDAMSELNRARDKALEEKS